jgi:hypothetical protein
MLPLHLNIKPQIGLYISTLSSLHSCTILTFQYHHPRAFKDYQKHTHKNDILNANGIEYPVNGAGDVPISKTLTLTNTLLVPSLSTKLIYVGQLTKERN